MSHFSYIYWIEEDLNYVTLCSLRQVIKSSQFLLVGLETQLEYSSIKDGNSKKEKSSSRRAKIKFKPRKKSKSGFYSTYNKFIGLINNYKK